MPDTPTEGGMDDGMEPTDPAIAPRAEIDRFSEAVGTLMVRAPENGLPEPNPPTDFDAAPFLTRGLGPGGGPASGFRTRAGSDRTHNGLATVPGDAGYSPLWLVTVYDNADFEQVSDLVSVRAVNLLASRVATVNCPVVEA